MKLTRKQIKEGLESVPLDTILLGTASAKESKLTPKQMEFARQVALGESKASAYRKSHNSKGKPKTQSQNGQNLLKNTAIEKQVEAFKVAFEAMKYQTPAHLRTLVIHKLTEKALDEEVPPAQQLKALELLGKITEVALFTERREIVKADSSEQVREKLIKSLTLAIKSSGAKDVSDTSAEELLRELSGKQSDNVIEGEIMSVNDVVAEMKQDNVDGEGVFDGDSSCPTGVASPFLGNADSSPLHSIPHTKAPSVSLTPVRHRVNPNVTQGEGDDENMVDSLLADLGKTPQGKDGSHG